MTQTVFQTIAAKGLKKVYGRQRALAGVDVSFRAGEATALLGPNGAGKSTLVGILATLVQPSDGEVRFGSDADIDEDDGEALRGAIGVIAHESLCYGDLSGRENLEFFARLHRVPEPRARAAHLLTRVGLDEAAARPARTYSRGMLQRLAVARALVHHPTLLLADEPFTGLDRAGVALLAELFAEERGRGAILLVVTHDFDAVASFVDRAVVLVGGRIAADESLPPPKSASALADLYREALARSGKGERARTAVS